MPRGKGERCFGFLSDDGKYAHCSRTERAGPLPQGINTGCFAHRLIGDCHCGLRHDQRPSSARSSARQVRPQHLVSTYDYTDEAGTLLYQVCRYSPKDFRQRQPDGSGGWLWHLRKARLVPYHLPELVGAAPGSRVFVCEGEKDADAVRGLGLVATTNAQGAGKWRPEFNAHLNGCDVVILPHNDPDGRKHAAGIAESLAGIAASVKALALPGLAEKGDAFDWIAAGGTKAALEQLADRAPEWEQENAPPPPEPKTLEQVHEIYARWLYMPNHDGLDVILGAYAANRGKGIPFWLIYIAQPGAGKTEKLSSIVGLPDVRAVGTLTMASLLSGTPARDRSKTAKGGLLADIGERGIVVLPDFGSVLAMSRDPRAEVLQGLRQTYDGHVVRHVGSDGGQMLEWKGKVGLIAGATPAIDEHHAVMGALGERFAFYRDPPLSDEDERALASRALDIPGDEAEMRAELHAAVAGLFAGLPGPPEQAAISADEREWLIELARFAVRARAPVTREPTTTRAIENVRGAEAPTRLIIGLRQLFSGLIAIGVERSNAWRLVHKVALDSMPQLRQAAIKALEETEDKAPTTRIAQKLSHPTTTVRRTLEELEAYKLVIRTKQDEPKPDLWELSRYAREAWKALQALPPSGVGVTENVPEKSDDPISDVAGRERYSNHPHTALTDISGTFGDGQSARGAAGSNGHLPPDLQRVRAAFRKAQGLAEAMATKAGDTHELATVGLASHLGLAEADTEQLLAGLLRRGEIVVREEARKDKTVIRLWRIPASANGCALAVGMYVDCLGQDGGREHPPYRIRGFTPSTIAEGKHTDPATGVERWDHPKGRLYVDLDGITATGGYRRWPANQCAPTAVDDQPRCHESGCTAELGPWHQEDVASELAECGAGHQQRRTIPGAVGSAMTNGHAHATEPDESRRRRGADLADSARYERVGPLKVGDL